MTDTLGALFLVLAAGALMLGLLAAVAWYLRRRDRQVVDPDNAADETCPIPRMYDDEAWTGPAPKRWYDTI